MDKFHFKTYVFLLITLSFTSSQSYSQGGILEWGRFMGGSGSDYGIRTTKGIAIDPNFGDTYSIGVFMDSIDFDPGAGFSWGTSNNGYEVFYINKLNSAGNFLWTKFITSNSNGYLGSNPGTAGSINLEHNPKIVVDLVGNIYITGVFEGTVDFDPGPSVFNLTASSGLQLFILKLNSSGGFVWAKTFDPIQSGFTEGSYLSSICFDNSLNLIVAGTFRGTVDFNPGAGVNTLTYNPCGGGANGLGDIFICKLDSSGGFIWVKGVTGSAKNTVNGVNLDLSGNIYVSGTYENCVGPPAQYVDFNPGSGIFSLPGSTGNYILKLNSLGNFVWVVNGGLGIGNGYYQTLTASDIDALGNLYYASENVISKKDINGATMFNISYPLGAVEFRSLDVDLAGNLLVAGGYSVPFDADPGPGVYGLPAPNNNPNGYSGAVLIKFDSTGNLIWAKAMYGGLGGNISSLITDDVGGVYVNGPCNSGFDVNPSSGVLTDPIGYNDFFVAKFSPPCNNPSISTVNLTECDSINIQGINIQTDTTLTLTYIAANGCDSIVDYTINIEETFSPTICLVTVDSLSSHNVIIYEKPAGMTSVDSFYVYREVGANVYQIVGALSDTSFSVFDDLAANPNSTSFKYKISSLNVCGQTSSQSPYHSTIHLQYLGAGNFQWTNYLIENVANPVLSYSFYRDNNSSGSFQLIQVIPGNNNTFTDVNYASYPNASYRVEVNWFSPVNCNPTSRVASSFNTSKSNILAFGTTGLSSVNQYPIIISPNPANEQFQIDFGYSYISLLGGTINIYNALGQSVYSSSIEKEKQTVSRSMLDASGIYFISITSPQGLEISRNKLVLQ